MSKKIFRLSSLLGAFVFAAAAFCVDLRVPAGNAFAQNANSSMTMNENSNTGSTHRKRGRRHKAPAAAAEPTADTTTSAPAADATVSTAPAQNPTASGGMTEQTDLSGTYAGTFECSDAGLSGETTLTITGNQFTTSDGKSGRITAATTRGYTAVAMQFGELTAGTSGQPGVAPVIVSMRAKKSRDRLTLSTVPGATHVCSFMPAGSRVARSRRTSRSAAAPAAPAAVAEPVAAPATTPEPAATPGAEAGPMPPTATTPARRGRKSRRTPTTNTNANSNANTNSNPTMTPAEEGAKPKPSPTPN